MFEELSLCPLCASTEFEKFLQAKDYTASGESFTIVRCVQCQFTFTNPRPAQTEIGRYYQSEKYISHTGGGRGLLDKIYLSARNFTLRWKLNSIHAYQKPGELLDFGCGTGEFLAFCQSKGWVVTGVEPSENARTKANQNIGKTVSQNISEIGVKQFDAITLWHVLEHIHELESELKKITSHLKKDGTIFIAVPNYQSPDGQYYKQFWAGYDVPRHLWHFSKDSMKQLLSKVGLQLLEIKPMKLDAFYVSLLSESYQNPQSSKLVNGLKAFIKGMKSNHKARENNNYSSLIYIAKHS
jgi:2-polyprenyl-3-methyl-5-hydroxy-6-metoxy-1,4-benzoquinol methylase